MSFLLMPPNDGHEHEDVVVCAHFKYKSNL